VGTGRRISSPARKNLSAAASSRKPITTLTLLSQPPLLGSLRNRLGKSASRKNGAAKVAAKASAPRISSHHRNCPDDAMPPNPPRNGATQVKLTMVKVRAMNTVPTTPPCPSRAEVKRVSDD